MKRPSAPRVGLVGPRSVRQGLGPHLARFLVRRGATLPAFVGSSAATLDRGRDALLAVGVDARGYDNLGAAIAAENLDAVVIASPADTHRGFLETALHAGVHVLTEKPFLWGRRVSGGGDGPRAARRLEVAFETAGLVLFENCQWPYTLASFDLLHPEARARRPRRFEMWLSPTSRGRRMLVDALSHPISCLQTLVAAADGEEPEVSDVAFSTTEPDSDRLDLTFRYTCGEAAVDVVVRLRCHPEQPRPAGYAINGHRAERQVTMPDYAFRFADAGRDVAVPDPMDQLVADFVAAVRGERPPRVAAVRRGLGARQRLLEALIDAYPRSDYPESDED